MSLILRLCFIFSIVLFLFEKNVFSYADPLDPQNRCLTQRRILIHSSRQIPVSRQLPVPVPCLISESPLNDKSQWEDDCSNLNTLISAIRYGDIRAIKNICQNHPWAVNKLDEDGNLPLHHAVQSNYKYALIMVKALIEIDPDGSSIENNDGDTPLTLARAYGRKDVKNYLEEILMLSHSDSDGERELSQHASDCDSDGDGDDDNCDKDDQCSDDCASLEEDTQSVSDYDVDTDDE